MVRYYTKVQKYLKSTKGVPRFTPLNLLSVEQWASRGVFKMQVSFGGADCYDGMRKVEPGFGGGAGCRRPAGCWSGVGRRRLRSADVVT